MALLTVRGLTTSFSTDQGIIRAVNGVSFTLEPGEVLGLVGESGSGKSVTALSIMRLVREPPAKGQADPLAFGGADPRTLRDIRGSGIAMIFQDPMRSLNPVLTIGRQLTETLVRHINIDGNAARRAAMGPRAWSGS